jgi:putative sporulation protein YtaF
MNSGPGGMSILTAFLIALSCNLDNVGVGISYGARGIKLPFLTNLYIALLTAAGTCMAMVLGGQAFLLMSPEIGALLGGAILVVMGAWVIVQETFLRSRQSQEPQPADPGKDPTRQSLWPRLLATLDNPSLADQDLSGHIDLKEGTILGLALLLNNLPNGVAAAMIKLPVPVTTLAVGVLSLLTLWLGLGIGRHIEARWNSKWVWVTSGLILMGIGFMEIILALPVRL